MSDIVFSLEHFEVNTTIKSLLSSHVKLTRYLSVRLLISQNSQRSNNLPFPTIIWQSETKFFEGKCNKMRIWRSLHNIKKNDQTRAGWSQSSGSVEQRSAWCENKELTGKKWNTFIPVKGVLLWFQCVFNGMLYFSSTKEIFHSCLKVFLIT